MLKNQYLSPTLLNKDEKYLKSKNNYKNLSIFIYISFFPSCYIYIYIYINLF